MTEEMKLLAKVRDIAGRAGEEIMDVYARSGDIDVENKADHSPLTEADTRAHRLIEKELKALSPDLPVLSEESEAIAWDERRQWEEYWLVDPLDGTKEFISRNDEFTVNIALVRGAQPVLGVVHVPALGLSYSGLVGQGAWRHATAGDAEETQESISTSFLPGSLHASRHSRRQDTDYNRLSIRVVASRRHRGEELEALLARLEQKFGAVEMLSMGSSLKICLVAEGRADLYPRLAPTSEWDTGAAQAVLAAAGGALYTDQLEHMGYNQKEDLLNPQFFAVGDPELDWASILG